MICITRRDWMVGRERSRGGAETRRGGRNVLPESCFSCFAVGREFECWHNVKRCELFDARDAIDRQREVLISKIEKQLKHTTNKQTLFVIRWKVA